MTFLRGLPADYGASSARIYEHAEVLVTTSDAAGTYSGARLKAAEAGAKEPHKLHSRRIRPGSIYGGGSTA